MYANVEAMSWLVVKILVILGLTIYAVFAGVIVRQERLMANVIEDSSEALVRTLVFVHFVASLIVVGMAFILL